MKRRNIVTWLVATVTIVAVCVSSVSAVANSEQNSRIKYFDIGLQEYQNAAKVYSTGSGTYTTVMAATRITVGEPYHAVDAGTLGASADLYDQYGNLIESSPRATNTGKSNDCISPSAKYSPAVAENYYAGGFTYVWTGTDYHEESTYNTPVLYVNPSSYAVNEAGQTYGSASNARSTSDRPDLIAAIGTNGTPGYVYNSDLMKDSPKTPAEAIAQQEAYAKLSENWDGETPIIVRTIPLYAVDGETVIGEYEISFTPVDETVW